VPKLPFQERNIIQLSIDQFEQDVERTNSKTKVAFLVEKAPEINKEIWRIHNFVSVKTPILGIQPLYYLPMIERSFIYVTWVTLLLLNAITLISFNMINSRERKDNRISLGSLQINFGGT
jgi:hypothetical protein